jgi:hypothetical protein
MKHAERVLWVVVHVAGLIVGLLDLLVWRPG